MQFGFVWPMIFFLFSGYPVLITAAVELGLAILLAIAGVHIFRLYGSAKISQSTRAFCKATVLKSWGFTLIAQVGMMILLFPAASLLPFLQSAESEFPVTDPQQQSVLLMTVIAVILLTVVVAFILNYFVVYRKHIALKVKRALLSLWMSVLLGPILFIAAVYVLPPVMAMFITK